MSPPPQPPPPPVTYRSDLDSSSNTTFVQADPSNFRTIVQRLTGASDDPSTPKLPLTPSNRPTNTNTNTTTNAAGATSSAAIMGPKRPPFKLHERRQTAKKLEISLNRQRAANNSNPFLVSPVSTLEFLPRVSPGSPSEEYAALEEEEEEEKRVIAQKGFYLHKSPLSTPRGGGQPELLPLFPLTSPRNNDNN